MLHSIQVNGLPYSVAAALLIALRDECRCFGAEITLWGDDTYSVHTGPRSRTAMAHHVKMAMLLAKAGPDDEPVLPDEEPAPTEDDTQPMKPITINSETQTVEVWDKPWPRKDPNSAWRAINPSPEVAALMKNPPVTDRKTRLTGERDLWAELKARHGVA